MTTTTQLKNVAQHVTPLNLVDLKQYTPLPSDERTSNGRKGHKALEHKKHVYKNPEKNTFAKQCLVLCMVMLVHIFIALIAFRLATTLPTPPTPEQPMMVSLIENTPIIEHVSTQPQHKAQQQEVKPQSQPRVNPVSKTHSFQANIPAMQAPATQAVTSQEKVTQENAPTTPAQTKPNDAKSTSELAQKLANESPVKEDIKLDVVEPPRFGVAYLNNPKPNYPNLSRRAGEQGRVLFKVLVGTNGETESVEIAKTSGFERLDQAGLDAVKQWRFVPAKKNNQTISAYVVVPVSFSLE